MAFFFSLQDRCCTKKFLSAVIVVCGCGCVHLGERGIVSPCCFVLVDVVVFRLV